MINHLENVARRKLGIVSPDWFIGAWEKIGPDAVLCSGGVTRTITKGPRKGRKAWGSMPDKVVVTDAEEHAERLRYETETGKCANCDDGQTWAGWHHETGNYFKTCTRCKGSGKAPA